MLSMLTMCRNTLVILFLICNSATLLVAISRAGEALVTWRSTILCTAEEACTAGRSSDVLLSCKLEHRVLTRTGSSGQH